MILQFHPKLEKVMYTQHACIHNTYIHSIHTYMIYMHAYITLAYTMHMNIHHTCIHNAHVHIYTHPCITQMHT